MNKRDLSLKIEKENVALGNIDATEGSTWTGF